MGETEEGCEEYRKTQAGEEVERMNTEETEKEYTDTSRKQEREKAEMLWEF